MAKLSILKSDGVRIQKTLLLGALPTLFWILNDERLLRALGYVSCIQPNIKTWIESTKIDFPVFPIKTCIRRLGAHQHATWREPMASTQLFFAECTTRSAHPGYAVEMNGEPRSRRQSIG